MSSAREDISDAGAGAVDHLGFSAEELLEELGRLFGVGTRRPGDLDMSQIQERFRISRETIRVKMQDLVEAGKYERLWVMDGGKKVKVYRKKL